MKDEIKEILDKLNSGFWEKDEEEITYKILFSNEVYQLLDYITNLQTIEREYSALLSENAELENKITNLQEENERLKHQFEVQKKITDENIKRKYNYKSRNEKAIDKIQNMIESNNGALSNPEHTIVAKHKLLRLENDDCEYLLNILQGKSDE